MFTFLFSFPLRRELAIVGGALGILVLLPILAVASLLNVGLADVSGAVAQSNPETHVVTLYAPDGSIRTRLTASSVWPVHGPVSLEFGADDSPYQKHHTGIDIAIPTGTLIRNSLAGTVTAAANNSSEGNHVYVDSGNGIVAHYLHLSSISVIDGQTVKAGDSLGLSGNTGYSTGPHLHFEIRVAGIPINPRTFEVGNP